MAHTPKLSIVTVCLNAATALRRTYNALLEQTGIEHFEWIVVDGESDDTTDHVMYRAERDKKMQIQYLSEKDDGLYDAMNKGLQLARGEYCMFLNAGDVLSSLQSIQSLLNVIEAKHHSDFIYNDSYEISRYSMQYKRARSHKFKTLGMFTHHQAMVFKTAMAKTLSFDTDYKIAADYDFTLRFLEKAQTVFYNAKPLCIFQSGGLSQQNPCLGRNELFDIRKSQNLCPEVMNRMIWTAQFLNWKIREKFPGFYWFWKQERRSFGSRQIDSAPI